MPIATVNPYTNETLKTFQEQTPKSIERALETAAAEYRHWRTTSFADRAAILHRVAAILRRRREELAKLITTEMGKLIAESVAEVDLSADIFDYYADHGEIFLADQPVATERGEALLRHSPIGLVLGVEPWNFPVYQVARFAAPNVMIGNVVLVKHASNVPQCAIAIESAFQEAGAPAGLYTNLLIPGSKVSELVADERIQGAALTGSEVAGASLAAAAGKSMKKSVLELGGSDALIVLEDADIDQTVEWAFVGRMNNTGQCCVASKRLIVVEPVADEFIQKFVARMSNLRTGDPLDPSTQLGPLSSEAAAVELEGQIRRAVEAGATVLLGGKRIPRKGAFLEATVLTDVTPGTPISHEELFGPVAVIYRVPDEESAIRVANDSPFGLGGSVFTSDVERGKRVADRIDTGMVFINHPTWTAPELPFGGIKRSGYGRELSSLGVEEFVNKKLIRVSSLSDPF